MAEREDTEKFLSLEEDTNTLKKPKPKLKIPKLVKKKAGLCC